MIELDNLEQELHNLHQYDACAGKYFTAVEKVAFWYEVRDLRQRITAMKCTLNIA